MNKANECTCPSGDGSLVHPCPAHPAVEQAGANVGHGHVLPRADGVKMRCGGPGLCSECTADASRARAALAQPSQSQYEASFEEWLANELEGEDGQPVPAAVCDIAIARRAFNHWPKLEQPAKVGGVRFSAGVSSRLVVEAAQRLYEFESTPEKEAERPEVAEVAFVLRNIGAMDAEDIDGDNVDLRFEDAEGRDTGCDVSIVEYAEKAADLFEQHDRIVGALRAKIAQLRQHKNDYMDAGQETYRALQNEIREREAEIARLDGLVSGRTAERDAALARVKALEALVAARIKDVPVDAPVIAVVGDFNEEQVHECKRFHDAIRAQRNPKAIVVFLNSKNDIQAVDEAAMCAAGWVRAEAPVAQAEQAPPSEDQLIAAGLSYPLAKEDAVKLWYSGFRSEVITVLEAWEAIGHDTGINPDKEELLESLRNMAAICNAHGNEMPAQSAIDQRQVIADAITGALAFGAQASQPPAADHWLRPFYDIGRAEGQRTQELSMLVRMLASSLKRHAPESNLVARATNYLAAKGLAGTPLRDAPASVEQAGGDERAALQELIRVRDWVKNRRGQPEKLKNTGQTYIMIEKCETLDMLEWAIERARAALAQPSPVRSSLLINGYQLRAALDFIAPDGTAEQLKSEACIEWRQQDADFLEAGLYAFCAEYPEEGGVLLDEEPTTAQPSPLQSDQAEAERPALWAVHAQGPDELYAAFSREDAEKHAAELNALPMPEGIAVGAVVVPSPWPAVQHWQYLAEQEQDHKNEIAGRLRQLERICEGLPQDAIDGGWTVQGIRGYAKRLEDQLKAALARVADMKTMADNYCALLMDANAKLAEMERQEPVALANRGLHAFWVKWTEAAAGLYGPGIKLYAAPVAQAQHSVPEVSGIGRDFAYPRSVVLYLRTEPTDDDLRAIHDGLL
ncbi:TPA: hypothetical protein SMN94_006501, partial [Pseudomonas aeruginosa]|nr:hypothetical protein [Pseudomonas aeruginosa]